MVNVSRLCAVICLLGILTPVKAQQSDDARQQFAQSLSLRADRIIADSTVPSFVRLTQASAVSYQPAVAMKLKLSLYASPPPQAAPGGNAPPPTPLAADAKPVKEFAASEVYPRDLISRPLGISVDVAGVPDGNYRIVGELSDGDSKIATLEQSIWLAAGIESNLPDTRKRLDKIQGHESTKASVLYPFDYARVINTGRRAYDNGRDIGIDESDKPNFVNWTELLKNSRELLAALESGKDPLWQAKGDHKRNYVFAETGEIMPYRVYVPSTWDGKKALPLIFILHGNTRSEDFYFDRNERIIPNRAEKDGYMLVATFGYHPNGGYNYNSMSAGRGGRGGAAAFGSTTAPAGRGARGGGGNPFMNGMPASRLGELSEMDTMNVFDLIQKEYPIDPKRTFLFGYSAGGNGSYYMAQKYPDKWVAVALGGANMQPTNYAFDRVKHLPFMIEYGDKDTGVIQPSKNVAAAMKEHGMDVELVELKGHDHNTAVAGGTPFVFDFFNKHAKK